MKKTRMLAISSMMAALAVAILSVGSLVESLDLSLSILAGLVILVVSTEYGDRIGLAVFLVSGVLSLLLLPIKSPAILFLALAGWYPIVQKKINLLSPILSRVLKTLIFNFVLILLLVLSFFVTGVPEVKWVYATLFLLGNACFVLYDLLLDRVFLWYLLKLRKRLKF